MIHNPRCVLRFSCQVSPINIMTYVRPYLRTYGRRTQTYVRILFPLTEPMHLRGSIRRLVMKKNGFQCNPGNDGGVDEQLEVCSQVRKYVRTYVSPSRNPHRLVMTVGAYVYVS